MTMVALRRQVAAAAAFTAFIGLPCVVILGWRTVTPTPILDKFTGIPPSNILESRDSVNTCPHPTPLTTHISFREKASTDQVEYPPIWPQELPLVDLAQAADSPNSSSCFSVC